MKIIFLALIVFSYATSVYANAKVIGNAGRGVVCSSTEGVIQSVTSLDLYEARVIYGLQVDDYGGPSFEQIIEALGQKIDKAQEYKNGTAATELKRIHSKMRMLPPNTHLKPVDDSGEVLVLPAGCEVKQLANYISDTVLLVDGDYWNKMNDLNRAALTLHEWMYRIMRSVGDSESMYSRKVVSYLLSTEALVPVKEGLPKTNYFRCHDAPSDKPSSAGNLKYEFYVYPLCAAEGCPAVFQFEYFDGRLQFSRTQVVSRLSFADFKTPKSSSGGQDLEVIKSKISDGEELWWRYDTNTVSGDAHVQLSLATSHEEPPTDTDFIPVICFER